MTSPLIINPELDLVLEREIAVPRELVWEAWTTPASLKHWFAPRPWEIIACEIDLKPGGKLAFTMRSPEGQEFPNTGCYLDIVRHERLVWTDSLLPGFRPAEKPFFTAALVLEPLGAARTKYTAYAIHGSAATRDQHIQMGFHEGWGIVVDQMVEHIQAAMKKG